METIELSAQDRERMDTLIELIERNQRNDIIVSCTEAARLIGRSKKTVSMMIRDGRLRKVTIGESTGIRLSDIRNIQHAQ